jgi:hypothetical protein
VVKCFSTFETLKSREDLDRPLVGTRRSKASGVGIFGIGKSEFLKTRKLGHHKSRNPGEIETVHQRRTHGRNWRHLGKSRQEVVDRRLGYQDIMDPGDKVFIHFGIANLETPTRRQVSLWARYQQIREGRKLCCVGDNCQPIGIRRIGNPRSNCILALETPKPRRGIRLRSWR